MTIDKIKYRVIKPEESAEVAQFIADYFLAEEPMCSCEPIVIPCANHEQDFLEHIKLGMSIMAVRETEDGGEELVGVNIGHPRYKSSSEEYFKLAENESDKKYRDLYHFLGVVTRDGDIFNRYGVDKVFLSYVTCVKAAARGNNIGERLKIELMALAKSLGFEVITADCSSFYSAAVCERLGWEKINYISFSDYVDEDKKQIFNPPPPHTGMTSFAKRL